MPLLYSAYQSTLETKDGEKLWHPRLKKVGEPMTAYELGVAISKRTALSAGDSLNCVAAMQDIFYETLLSSRSICLDRIGTFTVTCRSTKNGVKTEEEVSAKQITDLKVRFTPAYTRNVYNGTTRAMFEGVTFEKIGKTKKADGNNTNPDPNPGGGGGGDEFIDPSA